MFDGATRLKRIQLPDLVRPTGGGTNAVQLPRTGLLKCLFLAIRGSVAGTLTVPNAFGMASIIRNMRLTLNSGIDDFNMSGQGYHYLFRQIQEDGHETAPQSNARSAVTATTYNLDAVIPVMLNERDPIGLLMLQSEQMVATFYADWLADASVATGATVTGTITPYVEVFTVPANDADLPPLNYIHRILETQEAVPAAGAYTYNWPRGNRYLQLVHGLGFGAAGADGFTRYAFRVNQGDYSQDTDTKFLDIQRAWSALQQRLAGTIVVDLMGSSGFGVYDKMRDTIDSSQVTDIQSLITAGGAGTLYTIRRELVRVA